MKKKMRVYVLGNPLVQADKNALKLLPHLIKSCPSFEFVTFDPTEEFNPSDGKELIMIDAATNIGKVTVFSDLKYFTLSKTASVHDYDLPLSLGLNQKLGKLKKFKIIAVPQKGIIKKMVQEVIKLL